MIFVISVHVGDRWQRLQGAAIQRWIPGAAELQARGPGDHGSRLNTLALEAIDRADDADLLITLDSDAWPVADPLPTLERLLARVPFVAVRRDEAAGARQPHPCFSACRAGFWRALPGDWTESPMTDATGRRRPAVGGLLLERLGDRWAPLLRMNRVNPHPLMFGLYGDTDPLVYHHGAGSREPSFYAERRALSGPALRAQIERNAALSAEWYERAQADETFWQALL